MRVIRIFGIEFINILIFFQIMIPGLGGLRGLGGLGGLGGMGSVPPESINKPDTS